MVELAQCVSDWLLTASVLALTGGQVRQYSWCIAALQSG